MPFRRASVHQSLAIFFLIFLGMIGGSWVSVKLATDHLLYEHATSTAQNWGRYLAGSVGDLEQISNGEQPSAASMEFFRSALKAGQVFRYEIFSRYGYSQLVADSEIMGLVDISEFSDDAKRAVAREEPFVDVKEGTGRFPSFYARAYVPVLVNGRPIAVVAAYVDQTQQRDRFFKAFLIATGSVVLLIALSIGIPVIAWYRRTKEKQEADQRLRYLADHDVLTGLMNRNSLMEMLKRHLGLMPTNGPYLAVHFLDLDRFKSVNDVFGHDGGDTMLQTIAVRLRAIIRVTDGVARLGGDEFVVLQTGVKDEDDAHQFAGRIASAMTAPVQFGEQQISPTASIGIAIAPRDGQTSERLLKSADLALYKSKADGRNCITFFSPEMDAATLERIQLEKTLREALTNERFELHYQPVFGLIDRGLNGFEALLRLRGPNDVLIPPVVFIPVLEELRLIDSIGAWALRQACNTAATWPDDLTIAVNLSPAQFRAGSLRVIVGEALAESGLKPERLELEITETLLLGDTESTTRQLNELKAMGVRIVMDDFGTGYSSLSYLWRFPFDKIKIDRSFMLSSGESVRDAQTVVKTIIALGRELNMRVTVEGVETGQQVEFLTDFHADLVQGFYFGPPVPASELPAVMLKNLQQRTGRTDALAVQMHSEVA